MLRVESVTKKFGGLTAIDSVDLHVEEGGIVGLLGPNGAGKTTLFNIISGIMRPTAGQVFLDANPLKFNKPHAVAREGVGRTFQIVRPFSELSVLENVLSAVNNADGHGIISRLRHARSKKALARADELLNVTHLSNQADIIAKYLPLGQLRRLEIARALGLRPRLLLLDESFSGLSYAEATSLMDLVRELQQRGTTVLLIEHNMKVAMELCDTIAVLDHGRKIAEGSPDDVRANPAVITAYLGADGDVAA